MQNLPFAKRFIGLAVAAALPVAPHALAHAQQSPPAAFEVATVKQGDPDKMVPMGVWVYPGGYLVIHEHGLRTLIAEAFNVPGWQISGGEKWMGSLRFDIEAKPPESLRNTITVGEYANFDIQNADIRTMLQTLLIERFHLKFHTESQLGIVYRLERTDRPLRLQPAELHLFTKSENGSVAPSSSYPTGDIGLTSGVPISIHQTSMPQLARALSAFQRVLVIDQTGLHGYFNFSSQTVVTEEDFKTGAPSHMLVDALPEMGLKLVKSEGAVQKFIIDSATLPTPN